MRPSGSTVAEEELISRYEQMRQCALDGVAGAPQWGTALLVRMGMAAWLLASEAPQHEPERQASPRPPQPSPDDSKLVGVLATVILNNCWEQWHAS